MENMDHMYKNIVQTKDEEISQLFNRLKMYEDENKRLGDMNRTLQLTKVDR
jgi:hypothetical protein